MGIVANVHLGQFHPDKAQAEFIATARMCALTQVLHALASFDEAGYYFWSGDRASAKKSVEVAFGLLRGSREELETIVGQEAEFRALESDDNPKLRKAQELGLEWPADEFRTRGLAGDRRVMAMIDHLLLVEEQAIAGVDSDDLEPLCDAVSSPARSLAEQACNHIVDVVKDSRLAHELSDVVNQALVKERAAPPEVEFAGQGWSLNLSSQPAVPHRRDGGPAG